MIGPDDRSGRQEMGRADGGIPTPGDLQRKAVELVRERAVHVEWGLSRWSRRRILINIAYLGRMVWPFCCHVNRSLVYSADEHAKPH